MPHADIIRNDNVSAIGSAMNKAFHDPIKYAGFWWRIGTFINYGKGTQSTPKAGVYESDQHVTIINAETFDLLQKSFCHTDHGAKEFF
jgi:hypothetical protein